MGARCVTCAEPAAEGQALCAACHQRMAVGLAPYRPQAERRRTAAVQGDRRVVTVVSANLEDYQALIAGRDPEEQGSLMAAAQSALLVPIHRYGGAADRSAGDRLVARFGAPVAHEDDPERAVRAAWDLVEVARRVAGPSGTAASLPPIRIGIDSGLVVAGEAGLLPRGDYTVTGEAVTKANRLGDGAEAGQILVSAEVAAAAGAAFDFELATGAGESAVFVVRGPRTGPRHFTGPLVGRQGERLRIHGALLGAAAGHPQWLSLVGEAGTGKSRLARTAIQTWTGALRGRLLWAQATSLHRTPLGFVSALLGNWLGTGEKGLEALGERIQAVFPQDRDLALGLLGPLLGAPPPASFESLSPEHRQAAQFQALSDLLAHSAQSAPLLFVLEDLQWLDEPSLAWLGHFSAALAGRADLPIAILCELRPEAEPALAKLGAGLDLTRIYFGPLSPEDAESLAAALLVGASGQVEGAPARLVGLLAGPLADLASRVVAKAEGNPYFIEEMVRALESRGTLTRGPDGPRLAPDATQEIPESLMTLVASRLDDLPPATRRFAQVAAVLGRTFDPEILARVAGSEHLDESLDALVTARLVVGDGARGQYSFAQQVTWEVAYNSLLIRARRELHRLVAEALEARMAERRAGQADREAALIAHHWSQAADAGRAAQAYFQAGRSAAIAFANAEARLHFLSALDWLGRSEAAPAARSALLLELAKVETSLGNYDGALSRLEERSALAPEDPETLDVRGDVLERKGDFPSALAAFGQAHRLADEPAAKARAAAKTGSVHLRMGSLQEAIAAAREALGSLEGEGRPAEQAFAHSVLGMCHHRMGESDEATRQHEMALALRERARDLAGVAKSLNNLGIVANVVGRWSEAYQHYTRALGLFRKLGDRGYVAMALNNLGNLLLVQGDPVLAERHFREALRIARHLGDTVGMATALGNLGEVHLMKGAPAEALSFLDSCIGLTAQMVHHEYEYEVHHARARALKALADEQAARHELALAREMAILAGHQSYEGVLECTQAELELLAGRPAQALEAARRSESVLRNSKLRLELGRTLMVLARLLQPEEAERARDEAVGIFRELGARRDLEAALGSGAREEVKA